MTLAVRLCMFTALHLPPQVTPLSLKAMLPMWQVETFLQAETSAAAAAARCSVSKKTWAAGPTGSLSLCRPSTSARCCQRRTLTMLPSRRLRASQ